MTNVTTFAANDFSDIKHAIQPFNALADIYGEDMAAEQLRLEHEAYVLGEERFRKELERKIEAGEFADSNVATPLIGHLVVPFAEHITTWVNTKGRGRPHVSKKHLALINPSIAAYITISTVLVAVCRDKSRTLQHVANHIARAIEDEIRFSKVRDAELNIFRNRVKPALEMRKGVFFKREYMKRVEAGMIEEGTLSGDQVHSQWPQDERFHVGVRMLEMLIESTGLVTINTEHNGANDTPTNVCLSEKYAEHLTTRAGLLAGVSPMYQPCVVPPKPWTQAVGGGYWAKGRRPLPLVRCNSGRMRKVYQSDEVMSKMGAVMDAVNTIQNTAWSINKDVLAVANMVINWEESPIADIPSAKKLDLPERPEDIDTNEEVLKQWKRAASAVYRKQRSVLSRRMSVEIALSQANKYSQYPAIWFPYNLDWRGRVYAVPTFNPQGTDMVKGLLRFAEGKALGQAGAYWLAVHGSNCAGVDKVSLDDRVKWMAENEDMILSVATSPLDDIRWADMDSPFCFLAFCFEWAAYVESGRSEDFVSHIAVAFDGTCSGLQHLSAMLRDPVGGKAVNLLPADKPQDVYGAVADVVTDYLKDAVINGTEDTMELKADKKTGDMVEMHKLGTKTLAAQWLEFCNGKVGRSITKRSVMTLAYGSKKFGFSDQVRVDTLQPAIDKGEGHMFTAPSQAAIYMAGLIWDAVSVAIKAAPIAMKWLQDVAGLVSRDVKDVKEGRPVTWTTPIGFTVTSDYRDNLVKRIDCILLGSLRLQNNVVTGEKPTINVRKQVSGIAPNFVHSMDASHLMMTANAAHAAGINEFAFIHDSFGCHAGMADIMFRIVREQMVVMYTRNDVLGDFLASNIGGIHETQLEDLPAQPETYGLDLTEILKSRYTFS